MFHYLNMRLSDKIRNDLIGDNFQEALAYQRFEIQIFNHDELYSSHLNFRFLFFDTIMKYAENSSTKRNSHIYKNRILKCEKYIYNNYPILNTYF
jgi:hypothetical protein